MHTTTISTLRLAAVILGMALLASLPRARAQAPIPSLDPATAGKTYILAYPDTVSNILDARFPNNRVRPGFSLFIYSATAGNKVKIATPGNVSIVTPTPGVFTEYQVKDSRTVVDSSNKVMSNVIRVDADASIIVYCYFATTQSSEAWTPIPVEMWGEEYNVASEPAAVVNDIGIAGETAIPFYARQAPAEATIIAAYDGTHVTINDRNRNNLQGNPPRTITLNRNQAYQIQSTADTNITAVNQADIAGIAITSDQPIGVLSGNTRSLVFQAEGGLANNIYKNMLMEWLAPVGAQGTQFAYMPTWDAHRPDTATTPDGVRDFEVVRVIGNSRGGINGSVLTPLNLRPQPFTVAVDSSQSLQLVGARAGYIVTSQPAQVMMMSNSITKFEGSTPCFQGLPCLNYNGWAPYMVDLTPREQWTSFAPFIAPSYPSTATHYINVVTDTASARNIRMQDGTPFQFRWSIAGTDLVWGTLQLTSGRTYFLTGTNGARFGGFAYGLTYGAELYRPGRPAKGDGDVILGGDGDASALHPCEYEEYSALSYGYPLAPRRTLLNVPGGLRLDTLAECTRFSLTLRSFGSNPAGLHSIELDAASTTNARLVTIDPSNINDIDGRPNADVQVVPIDPTRDAKGTIIVTDRAGKVWRVPFAFYAQSGLAFDRPSLNFGITSHWAQHDTTVTITNVTSRDVVVKGVHTLVPGSPFQVVLTQPSLNPAITLPPGGRLLVTVRLKSPDMNGIFLDSLLADVECGSIGVPVRVEVLAPAIHVSDPVFGNGNHTDGGNPVTGTFDICNTGRLPLTLHNPNGGYVIEWVPRGRFTIPANDLAGLDDRTLAPGECVTVTVSFNASEPNTYRSVARVWASTRDSRDTSVWMVTVSRAGAAPLSLAGGYSYDGAAPNPFTGRTEFRFTLAAAGRTDLTVYNAAGEKVATLADEWMESGPHRVMWDATGLPSGRYFCRINSGAWHGGGEPGMPPISITLEK